MVGQAGGVPYPWLEAAYREAIALGEAHALLLHGPQGLGQFELALALAQARLCESEAAERPVRFGCGACASCRLFLARSHPDLLVVIPDALREGLGWAGSEMPGDDSSTAATSRAKPSKEIRVDDVRQVIGFAQSTSSRGRGRAVVVHPAERMNAVAANALLKTLEEPPGQTCFVLCSATFEGLLPTVRSRCQTVRLRLPSIEQAKAWLKAQGAKDPEILLTACGGHPLDALDWSNSGMDANAWLALPGELARGQTQLFDDRPLAWVIETLSKLCHDAMCVLVAARPRYFPIDSFDPVGLEVTALGEWASALRREARQSENPWNTGLKFESLIQQAKAALHGKSSVAARLPQKSTQAFVHSAP